MTVIDDKDKGKPETAEKPEKPAEQAVEKKDDGMLSQSNIASDTPVPKEEVSLGAALSIGAETKDIVITPEDKMAFIDSVVNNTRFERDYSLFGGKLTLTVRSITAEEANALAAYAFKRAIADPTWHMSGRGRKHLLAAQISKFNGTVMPPLREPLFETLEADGKTTKTPGWVESTSFWDGKGAAVIDAVMNCIADFDRKYSTLCKKAEDENFWAPDTP